MISRTIPAAALTLLLLTGGARAEDLSGRIDAYAALLETGEEEAARKILRDMLAEANPATFRDDADNTHQLAHAARRLNEFAVAERHNARTLELEPKNHRFLSMRGYLMLRLERPQEALDAYRAAIEHGADASETWYETGVAFLMLERPREAAAQFRLVLEQFPEDAHAHIQMAQALDASGDAAGALEHFEKAYELEPQWRAAAFNAGVAAQRTGQWARARRAFEHTVGVQPDDTITLGKMVQVCEAQGDLESRDLWRERVYELHRSGRSQLLNSQGFCARDQFPAGEKFVMAFEFFDYTRRGITDVKYSFHVLPDPLGRASTPSPSAGARRPRK